MISIEVKEINKFMHRLLTTDCFDIFLLEEAQIITGNSYIIDGHLNKEFYTREEWEDPSIRPYDYSSWEEMRPLCYTLIKGRRTPISFKFVLHLMPEHVPSILAKGETDITPDQIKALVLTIKYDNTSLNLITGTSYHTFLLDKTPDQLWDRAFSKYYDTKVISSSSD